MIFVLLIAVAQTEVAIDAGPMTPELVRLLRFERPDLAFTSSTSTSATRVSLRRDRELLSLEVIEDGAPAIERVIAVERDRLKPALRVAALLVVEALAPERSIIAAPVEPKKITVHAGGGLGLWLGPVTWRPVIAAAAYYRLDPASFGLRASFGCCRVANETLDGTVYEVTLLFDGGWALTELGASRLLVIGGFGATFTQFNGIAVFAPGAESPSRALDPSIEGAGRLGLAIETEPLFAAVRLVLALGAKVRLGRMIVQHPEATREGKDPLDPGILSPFLEISAAFDVF